MRGNRARRGTFLINRVLYSRSTLEVGLEEEKEEDEDGG